MTTKKKVHSQKRPTGHRHIKTMKTKSHNTVTKRSVSEIPGFKSNKNYPDLKACQELEIGDIGGFGDVQELEHHQKQCGDTAVEYCTSCGKHLCRIHYMLLHGDHDSHTNRNSASLA